MSFLNALLHQAIFITQGTVIQYSKQTHFVEKKENGVSGHYYDRDKFAFRLVEGFIVRSGATNN